MYALWTVLSTLVLLNKAGLFGCQSTGSLAPECYDTSTCPCCSVSCPSDGSGQCGGKCVDGYHGGKCYSKCPYNCIRCVDALQGGGVSNCTMCKDGHYSTKSLYQCQSNCSTNCKSCNSNESYCTSCHNGYFLTESAYCAKCNEACVTCNSYNTCTSCKYGFFFNTDHELCQKCSPLCYSCKALDACTCFNGCHKAVYEERICSENHCRFGCKPNFTSSIPNICDQCVNGNFGIECDLQCSNKCKSARCERTLGNCFDCKERYYGDKCQLSCPNNCESTCDKTSGKCDACRDGLFGSNCTLTCQTNCKRCNITNGLCQACIDGFYSIECEQMCPEKCQDGRCNKTNGSCNMCLPYYTGSTCDIGITTTSTNGLGSTLVVPADQHNYVGATVGLTLAAAVIIVGIVGVCVWCYRRRQHGSSNGNPSLFGINASIADIEKIEKDITRTDAQLSKLAANRSELSAKLITYQSNIPCQHTGNRSVFSITRSSSGVEKIDKKLARTDAQLNNLNVHRSELAARLMARKSNIPYRHAERADKVEERSYEMLQIVNTDSPYSSLQ